MNFFHCSVLPAGIGNAIANIAITSSSFSAAHFTAPVSFAKPPLPVQIREAPPFFRKNLKIRIGRQRQIGLTLA
jgi:hypothetical protein